MDVIGGRLSFAVESDTFVLEVKYQDRRNLHRYRRLEVIRIDHFLNRPVRAVSLHFGKFVDCLVKSRDPSGRLVCDILA